MYDGVYVYEFEGRPREQLPLLMDEDYVGYWQEGDYAFLFYRGKKGDLLARHGLFFRSELYIRHEDWESGVPLGPTRVGKIAICQPWNRDQDDNRAITIDPNMAFGSGFHASTKGCLTLLDRLFDQWKPQQILDLGTGTGVLSLACLKLGAETAIGVDMNNLAIETARRNRELNHLEERFHIVMAEAENMLILKADLLIANMHYGALKPLLELPGFYNREYLLVSGMIRSEGGKVREALEKHLLLVDTFSENHWSTLLFRRDRGTPRESAEVAEGNRRE